MGTQKQQGFTIIEVTLFLALTGLLAIMLLGGWTTMINNQRYKDSVRGLQSFLQQQYNLTYNVENGRSADLSCGSSGVIDNAATGVPRGQTDCVVMGRYILIQDSGEVEVSSIVGRELASDTSADDLASIRVRDPSRVSQELGLTDNKLAIPWGGLLVGQNGDDTPRNHAIVVIRSPLTGTVRTFSSVLTDPASPPSVMDMVAVANERQDTTLCISPGAIVTGGRMGVVIKAFASAQDGVQIVSDEAGTC